MIYRVLREQSAVEGGLDRSNNQRTRCAYEVYAWWLNSKTFQKESHDLVLTRLVVLTTPIALFSLSPQRKQAFHMRKGRIMSVGKNTSVAKMRSGHSAFLPAELLDGSPSEVRAHFRYLYCILGLWKRLHLSKQRRGLI